MKKNVFTRKKVRHMSILPEIKKTCIEMFDQRNYTINDIDENNIIIATKPLGHRVCFFLETISQFNVDKYQQYITKAEEMKTKHIIVICNKVTPGIQKNIRSSTNMDIKIETFHENELKYNITNHNLVPKHMLVDNDTATSLKTTYGKDCFSRMLKTDAVCRFYNFPSGSLVKVVRRDKSFSYRLVK